jgi:hypothetical protein
MQNRGFPDGEGLKVEDWEGLKVEDYVNIDAWSAYFCSTFWKFS